MTLKTQLQTFKQNWLLIAVVLLVVLATQFASPNFYGKASNTGFALQADYAVAESMPHRAYYGDDSFAPDIQERKVTKTSSLTSQVEKGEFNQAQAKLKAIIQSTNSYLLNENSNTYDQGRHTYHNGYYTLKVDTKKYDAVITQLKDLGEITSFNENARDITSSYSNTQIELEVERERLQRYQQMYNQATSVEDKINLNDHIFDQERRVKYLEDSLTRLDQKVEYTTISVTLEEKRSEYANIVFVKWSQLVRSLTQSINSLFTLLFTALPYALAILLGWVIYKRKRK